MNVTDEELKAGIDRLARTPDGYLLYIHLQRTLCSTVAPNAVQCALPSNEGRRIHAAELMALMRKGIYESGRPTDPIVCFVRPEPKPGGRTGGAGRRITADTHVPGYDD